MQWGASVEAITEAASKLSALLDAHVDDLGMWADIPQPFGEDEETGYCEKYETPSPEGLTCSFCKCSYCPVDSGDGYWGEVLMYSTFRLGMGRDGYLFWPVCSGACEDALKRTFDARVRRTNAELRELRRCRQMLRETKLILRLRRRNAEKP